MKELTRFDPRTPIQGKGFYEKSVLNEDRELSIFDEDNPDSLVNRAPNLIVKTLKSVYEIAPELFDYTEEEIRDYLKPGQLFNKLRVAFWIEYDRASRGEVRMDLKSIYAGLCARETFYGMLNKNQGKFILWITKPTISYQKNMEDAFNLALVQVRNILEAPLMKNNGELDTAAANIMLKIYDKLDQRLNGGVVQRLENKQLIVKKDLDKPLPTGEDLDKHLMELKKQVLENQRTIQPEFIDVEAIEKGKD